MSAAVAQVDSAFSTTATAVSSPTIKALPLDDYKVSHSPDSISPPVTAVGSPATGVVELPKDVVEKTLAEVHTIKPVLPRKTSSPPPFLKQHILVPFSEPNTPAVEVANPLADTSIPLSPKGSTRLRQMLARPGIVVAPGICDGISARCALEAGFTTLYQSGAATTASRLGQPDLAIATLNDFVGSASMINQISPSTPLIADADTGFGGPAMVARTVVQYHKAGVAGLHIEDQVQTKRCGHLMGKEVVPVEQFLQRIRAAVNARDSIPEGSDIVIIARTDSAQVLGMDVAIERLKAAAAAGADVAFIEGVKTKEDLQRTVEALKPTPVLVNVISGGLTPSFTTKEAEEMGAKIIIFSLVSAVAAVHGIRDAMRSLMETGTDWTSARGMDPRGFFEVMGLDAVVEIDAKAGGKAYATI